MNNGDSLLMGRLQGVLEELGDREPSTILQAHAVLENIRISKGFLDNEVRQDLENLKERSREIVLRNVEKTREIEAAYTRDVSEQLYSSKYRFIYEVIQNADDSSFSQANRGSTAPYVHFEVQPDALVIETNEDGFTRANVEAICATGRSSKKRLTSDSHIGEKGFGFKSVFSISNEVWIQSSIWSFRFQHQDGDSGLGMITPLDAPTQKLPEGVGTRITLQISDTTRETYRKLLQAISEIPTTTVFFLQRLQKITFCMTKPNGQIERLSITKDFGFFRNITVSRSREVGDEHQKDINVYIKFRYKQESMPCDRRRKGKTSVWIDIAFPVDQQMEGPKLADRGQYIFAYLPLQRVEQIPFLIQSDFITAANRESIVDCPWNEAICNGVAEAFRRVIKKHFATPDHALRYTWLEYLPTGAMDRPWADLYRNIIQRLREEPVLQSWERKQFKPPRELRQLTPFMIHNRQPLLKDLSDETYLSSEYEPKHSRILKDLGAIFMTWPEIIERIGQDLVSTNSRLKTKSANDSWHEAFALLVGLILSPVNALFHQRIKRLAIIPLVGGKRWTGAPGTPGGLEAVYFPKTGSIPIPTTIGLWLVDPTPASSKHRRSLYEAMGVEACPKEVVFARIKQKHQFSLEPSNIASHLRYLFHFHSQPDDIKTWVCMPLIDGTIRKASSGSFYLPSNEEYDLYQLLPEQVRADPNCFAKFLPNYLVGFESQDTVVRGMSLIKWLIRLTKARYKPRLCIKGTFSGSYYMARDLETILEHNPTRFVGTLKAHWSDWQLLIHNILSDLCSRSVPCQYGKSEQLCMTYLPSPSIMSKIQGFRLPTEAFKILSLPERALDDATYREWQFLERLGVKHEPDIEFYKTALGAMQSPLNTINIAELNEVYKCIARSSRFEDYGDLREFFHNENGIWDCNNDVWANQDECVWEGPGFLQHKTVLSPMYGDDPLLVSLFTIVLQIPNWTLIDILEELKTRQADESNCTEVSLAQEVYSFLNDNAWTETEWEYIRELFLLQRLVLGEHSQWHSRCTCLWQTPFDLNGYQDLSKVYPELEDFFIGRLGVKKASPAMLINEVKRMATQAQPQISEIRIRLIEIGTMIAKTSVDASILKALSALMEIKFLPKQLLDGTSVLMQVTDEFAISDHLRFGKALSGLGVLLDFQISEAQALHVLFGHLGITSRYLSSTVKEVSVVGDDTVENEELSKELQAKAYALYCCAAKGKSIQALRGDHALFELLRNATIYTSNTISTRLELSLATQTLSVDTDRAFVHHEIDGGPLKIYVPAEQRQRQACYRSQLPGLLARIMGVDGSVTYNISSIVACALKDLVDILTEQDISAVDWIDEPRLTIPNLPDDETSGTPSASYQAQSFFEGLGTPTVGRGPPGLATPMVQTQFQYHPQHHHHSHQTPLAETQIPLPALYPELIEQVVRCAQRTAYRQRNGGRGLLSTPPDADPFREFDHVATFGNRTVNEFAHDREIGAAGEAFVFETLSALKLPGFTRENWRSTIRGELASAARYISIQNWVGRETADIVYKDRTGELTQYLRSSCTGDFPAQISTSHDHGASPIEYYLEVKASTGPCSTRFFLSNGQHQRMTAMAPKTIDCPSRVYVIMRVFDLTMQNVGMKVFVNPLELEPKYIEFEAQGWVGRSKPGE